MEKVKQQQEEKKKVNASKQTDLSQIINLDESPPIE